MSEPVRLSDLEGPARRLLASAADDRPGPGAAAATLAALGLTAPAAPLATAAKGTAGSLLGAAPVKLAVGLALLGLGAVGARVVLSKRAPAPAPVEAPARAEPLPAAADGLSSELALLRGATEALQAGAAGEALGQLEEHRRRFPQGQLCEEAAALEVRALREAGRPGEAAAALDAFRARWPASPYEPGAQEGR